MRVLVGSDHPEGRAVGQRDRRRRARVHGLHRWSTSRRGRWRCAAASRGSISSASERFDKTFVAAHRRPADGGARRHRLAADERSRSSRTASRSSAASATSPPAASGPARWASTICGTWATRFVPEWNGCPDEALQEARRQLPDANEVDRSDAARRAATDLPRLVPRPVPRSRADPVDAGVHPAARRTSRTSSCSRAFSASASAACSRDRGATVRLVPADPGGRRRGRLLLPPRGRGRRPPAASTSRAARPTTVVRRREHDAAAAALRHRRRAVRDARAADGPRDGARCRRCAATRSICSAASPASSRSASCRGCSSRRRVWFACRVRARRCRCWLAPSRRTVAAAPFRPVGAIAIIGCCSSLSLALVHVMARGGALVAVLQDHRPAGRARHRRRGEQHLSPVDGAGRPQGILLPVAVHGRSATRSRTC